MFATAFKPYAPPLINEASRRPFEGKAPSPTPLIKLSSYSASRRICNRCAQLKLGCNGAWPACSTCRGRAEKCSYRSEASPGPRVTLSAKSQLQEASSKPSAEAARNDPSNPKPHSAGSIPNHHSVALLGSADTTPPANANIALRAPHSQLSPRQAAIGSIHQNAHESERVKESVTSVDTRCRTSVGSPQSERGSASSQISTAVAEPAEPEPSLESVTALLVALQKELHAWQEVSTQADLRQATVDARTRPQPKLDSSLPDPFNTITQQRRSSFENLPDPIQKKKAPPLAIRAPQTSFSTGAVVLPKYKALGRLSSSMLAPNHKIAKYIPYAPEDENDPDGELKYKDWREHYSIDFIRLKDQRECQDLAWLWKPWIQELLLRLDLQNSDLVYYFNLRRLDRSRVSGNDAEIWKRCQMCELDIWRSTCDSHSKEELASLPCPDNRTLTLAKLLACAFHDMVGTSLWHVAMGGRIEPRYEYRSKQRTQQSSLCLICFRHFCPDHGSYSEPNATIDESNINDSEQMSNVRKYVALPDSKSMNQTKSHMCGGFCVPPTVNLRQIRGRQPDGSVTGEFRAPKKPVRSILADEEACGPSCFWDVGNRRGLQVSEVKFQPFMSASQKVLVEKLIPFYLNNQRGPCLISRIIKDVDCLMVFHHMMFAIHDVAHPDEASGNMSDSSSIQRGSDRPKKKRTTVTVDVSKTADLATRPPFLPCSHEGPCYNNPDCSCAASKVHCERFCGCDQSCKRRFRGCACKAGGRKICFEDNRCDCWANSRECDPQLCGKCGVFDILDSSNKYRDDIRVGRCRNNRIQLGLPAPTTKAPSQVQGYGLYSRAEILMGDFIGEYTGEVIGRSEGNRRGTIYHLINQEYLFNLNLGQEIDASSNGNKMRFMNNSQREENINVEAKSLLCSGVVRIGLFARRDVRAGEELLWKYGYSAELVKYFWEPGEKPATDRALIPFSKQRLARNTGRNKLAGEGSQGSRDHSSQPVAGRGKVKRKRHGTGSSEPEESEEAVEESAEDTAEKPKAVNLDNSDDSDYFETNGQVSEEGEDAEGSEVEDSDLELLRGPRGRGQTQNGSPRGGIGSGKANGPLSSSSIPTGGRRPEPPNSLVDSGSREGSKQATGRKRQLNAHDKRIGGRAQQQGWQTRKRKMAMAGRST